MGKNYFGVIKEGDKYRGENGCEYVINDLFLDDENKDVEVKEKESGKIATRKIEEVKRLIAFSKC